jgi:hypothetical protein
VNAEAKRPNGTACGVAVGPPTADPSSFDLNHEMVSLT